MTTLNLGLILLIPGLMYFYLYVIGGTILGFFKQDFSRYFAPLVGYAVFAYTFFGLFYLTTNFFVLLGVFIALLGGCLFWAKKKKIPLSPIPYLSLGLSACVGLYTLHILYPHFLGTDFFHFPPLFDHIKTAFTAAITQSGIPVTNPFCANPDKSYYYFLYYVPLAAIKIIFHTTAYEAELIGEVLTCLIGLPLIVGSVALLKKKECAWWEVLCCFLFIFMSKKIDGSFIGHPIDSLTETLIWTPNTFLASSLLILSLFWIHTKNMTYSFLPALLLAIALGMSPYVFLVAFGGIGIFCLYKLCTQSDKRYFVIKALKLLGWVALFSCPFLWIQLGATDGHGFPIKWNIYFWLNAPPLQRFVGFWTVFLLSQMPILYLINIKFLHFITLKKYALFYGCILASLCISCCLQSTIHGNDLGWRSMFVTVELFTIFAIYYFGGIKSWGLKIVIVGIAIYFVRIPYLKKYTENYIRPLSSESVVAIQRYVGHKDYFLNNIFRDWRMHNTWIGEANAEFAVLTERRSCYMSYPSTQVYCHPDSRNFVEAADRIFNKNLSQQDIEAAKTLKCNKFIFVNTDRNYNEDQILTSFGLRKIYENDQIKIWE